MNGQGKDWFFKTVKARKAAAAKPTDEAELLEMAQAAMVYLQKLITRLEIQRIRKGRKHVQP